MKILVFLMTLSFSAQLYALNVSLAERESAIENLFTVLNQRARFARRNPSRKLRPTYLAMDISHLKSMILRVLGPHDQSLFIGKEELELYRKWAYLFNRRFGRPFRYDPRFQIALLPMQKKSVAPEVFRNWLERWKLHENSYWIGVAKAVTWNNFPLALKLTRERHDLDEVRLSQIFPLLDRTREIALPHLRLVLLNPDAVFDQARGFLDHDALTGIMRLSRSTAARRFACAARLSGNSPHEPATNER